MKIAIIGYGRMGHAVERAAQARGHEVTVRIDRDNLEEFDSQAFKESDVAIEFSTPGTAAENVLKCLEAGVPVVSGTTGWDGSRQEVEEAVKAQGGALLSATNFSIGVYVFRQASKLLARYMERFPEYTGSLHEVHHVHKLDHPSGTALTVARDIIEEAPRLKSYGEGEHYGLPISCERRGEVPGIHEVKWESQVDSITLRHEAKSRDGFAIGAMVAAEWLQRSNGRKGVYGIEDVLN